MMISFYLKQLIIFPLMVDYIVDAVDTVTAKIKLVEIAQEKRLKLFHQWGQVIS